MPRANVDSREVYLSEEIVLSALQQMFNDNHKLRHQQKARELEEKISNSTYSTYSLYKPAQISNSSADDQDAASTAASDYSYSSANSVYEYFEPREKTIRVFEDFNYVVEIVRLRKENKDLQVKLEAINSDISSNKESIQAYIKMFNNITEELEFEKKAAQLTKDQHARLSSENSTLTDVISTLKSALQDERIKTLDLTKQNTALKKQLFEVQDTTFQEKNVLKEQLENVEGNVEELRTHLQNIMMQNTLLKEQLSSAPKQSQVEEQAQVNTLDFNDTSTSIVPISDDGNNNAIEDDDEEELKLVAVHHRSSSTNSEQPASESDTSDETLDNIDINVDIDATTVNHDTEMNNMIVNTDLSTINSTPPTRRRMSSSPKRVRWSQELISPEPKQMHNPNNYNDDGSISDFEAERIKRESIASNELESGENDQLQSDDNNAPEIKFTRYLHAHSRKVSIISDPSNPIESFWLADYDAFMAKITQNKKTDMKDLRTMSENLVSQTYYKALRVPRVSHSKQLWNEILKGAYEKLKHAQSQIPKGVPFVIDRELFSEAFLLMNDERLKGQYDIALDVVQLLVNGFAANLLIVKTKSSRQNKRTVSLSVAKKFFVFDLSERKLTIYNKQVSVNSTMNSKDLRQKHSAFKLNYLSNAVIAFDGSLSPGNSVLHSASKPLLTHDKMKEVLEINLLKGAAINMHSSLKSKANDGSATLYIDFNNAEMCQNVVKTINLLHDCSLLGI